MTVTVRARTVIAALAVIATVAAGSAVAGATLAPRIVAPATAFPDVPADAFYTAAVQWAKDNGITTGVGDTGLFQPDANVTRGQMVTFLERLASTEVVLAHPPTDLEVNTSGGTLQQFTRFARAASTGTYQIGLTGPVTRNGIEYALRSVEYCVASGGSLQLFSASAHSTEALVTDDLTPTVNGCGTLDVGVTGPVQLVFTTIGSSGNVDFRSFTSTWVPLTDL